MADIDEPETSPAGDLQRQIAAAAELMTSRAGYAAERAICGHYRTAHEYAGSAAKYATELRRLVAIAGLNASCGNGSCCGSIEADR